MNTPPLIATIVDPHNGEVTMYLANKKWGPIIVGNNLEDAKKKFRRAVILTNIAKTLIQHDYEQRGIPLQVDPQDISPSGFYTDITWVDKALSVIT